MSIIKVRLDELKKAVQWMEANTPGTDVRLVIDDRKLALESFDRDSNSVTISLFDVASSLMPKVTRTDNL